MQHGVCDELLLQQSELRRRFPFTSESPSIVAFLLQPVNMRPEDDAARKWICQRVKWEWKLRLGGCCRFCATGRRSENTSALRLPRGKNVFNDLEFHHTQPRRFFICRFQMRIDWPTRVHHIRLWQSELLRCILLCIRCHRIHHARVQVFCNALCERKRLSCFPLSTLSWHLWQPTLQQSAPASMRRAFQAAPQPSARQTHARLQPQGVLGSGTSCFHPGTPFWP